MSHEISIWLRLGERLLNKRWWLVAIASLSIFAFEFMEYQPLDTGVSSSFFFEIGFYGVFLPVSTGLALTWAALTRAELAWLAYSQDLTHNLDTQLQNVHSHHELAMVFIQFVQVVFPVVAVSLYKNGHNRQDNTEILNWSSAGMLRASSSSAACAAEACPLLAQNIATNGLRAEICPDASLAAHPGTYPYCLPFIFSDQLIAGARLHFHENESLSPQQVRLLKEIAPEVSAAFQRLELERSMQQRDSRITEEQKRIARDVHDALGNNLAYLRLRLDQLSLEFDQISAQPLHQEVEALREIASDTYSQLRDILTTLSTPDDTALADALMQYAERMSQRGSSQLRINHHGTPRLLQPVLQRNCLFMVKEILTNIEKHAQAHSITMDLDWRESEFEIGIYDDGTGFEPAAQPAQGHFGLGNIRQRASEMNAQLEIWSQPGHGTRLTIQVPYMEET